MPLTRAICDLLGITSVFLLSVEAIKIKNLEWMRTRGLKPFLGRISPKVKFVETFPPGRHLCGTTRS